MTLDHWVRRSVRKRQWTAGSPLAATSGGPMAGSGKATPKRHQPLKKKAKRKEKSVKKSRSGSSGGKRCSKCKKKSDKFFRLPHCPVKPKDDSFAEYERYVADKYLHDECMRRIGKKGEIRKDERICNRCKVETKTKSLCID